MLATNSRNRYRTQAGQAGGAISVLAQHCRAAVERGDAEGAREMASILTKEARKTGLYWAGPDSDPCALCGHTYEAHERPRILDTDRPARAYFADEGAPTLPCECRAGDEFAGACPCPSYVAPGACEHCGCMAERHRDGKRECMHCGGCHGYAPMGHQAAA